MVESRLTRNYGYCDIRTDCLALSPAFCPGTLKSERSCFVGNRGEGVFNRDREKQRHLPGDDAVDSLGALPPELTVGQKIDRDYERFRKIVRGKVKSNLGKYISRGEMIGQKGKDLISIPLPQIDIPQFRYGNKGQGGVGQGKGDVGTPLGPPQPGDGSEGAGSEPGGHILEVELSLGELAAILGEELALPRIEPRGKKNIISIKDKYTGVRHAGPESLRHFKRTFKKALLRQIASKTYDPERPIVVPIREDKLYRSWKEVRKPESVAVIIYMMDVSGSMTDEQKEIVRIEAFWIDAWIKAHYKGIETAYIIHDAVAHLVDEHTFYHTRESGGTKISSAYELATQAHQGRIRPTNGTYMHSIFPMATTGGTMCPTVWRFLPRSCSRA